MLSFVHVTSVLVDIDPIWRNRKGYRSQWVAYDINDPCKFIDILILCPGTSKNKNDGLD